MKTWVLAMLVAVTAWAEPALEEKSGSWKYNEGGGRYEKLNDGGKATELSGKVLSTGRFDMEKNEPGVALRVGTESGDYTVHVGPRWFVLENDLNFTRGERINIVGIKIQFQKKPVIVATRVARKDKTVILRDVATGQPKWLGPRGKGPGE